MDIDFLNVETATFHYLSHDITLQALIDSKSAGTIRRSPRFVRKTDTSPKQNQG